MLTLWVAPPRMLCNCTGFNGVETNCGIAHILGILLKNSYEFQILLEATFIYSLSNSNYSPSYNVIFFRGTAEHSPSSITRSNCDERASALGYLFKLGFLAPQESDPPQKFFIWVPVLGVCGHLRDICQPLPR